ncbi:MAG: VWA domain-containing protein [Acidobacteriota bacterium]
MDRTFPTARGCDLRPRHAFHTLGLFASSVLCLLMFAGPIAAQDATQGEARNESSEASPAGLLQSFDDLVEVSEVFVDVLATDAEGQVVRDLGADDFIVEEDGESVELTSVSYYSTRYEDGASETDVPSSRYLVFFLDDQSRFGNFGNRLMRQKLRAVRDAKKWVRDAMLPSDWMAVVSYDGDLRLHQDFTQDPELLQEALQRAAVGGKPKPFRPGRREALDRGRELEILSLMPTGPELEQASENIYSAMGLVGDSLGFLIGRKVMLLYTVGFGVKKGRTTVPDERYYPALETVLNDHNIAVYPIDLTPSGLNPKHEDFLTRLAEDTGGYYDPNFVGFFDPLQEVTSENFGYYLLTYRAERPSGEIGYQKLEVRAKDPSITVRARTGYRYGL